MITRYKLFKENLLKPTTSLEDKLKKIQASNKQLLISNEVLIIGELKIDKTWNFELDPNLIKCKKIVGHVQLHLNNNIPEWLKDMEIDGYFSCLDCDLNSLKNCPKIITGSFFCNNNNLTSLEDGPTFVGKNYFCEKNKLTSLNNCPKIINGSFNCSDNNLTTLEDGPTIVNGTYYSCKNNDVKFTKEYVRSICEVKYDVFINV